MSYPQKKGSQIHVLFINTNFIGIEHLCLTNKLRPAIILDEWVRVYLDDDIDLGISHTILFARTPREGRFGFYNEVY
jgi:hypothetical protein